MSIFATLCAIFGCTARGFVSVDADEFAREIVKSGVQLVDVRTAEEYANGHLPAAVNMDVFAPDFAKQIATLDKERTVALYCRSGRRSEQAGWVLEKAFFRNVVDLKGGYNEWVKSLEK